MRRDVCYFFETDVKNLYSAYLMAAKGEPFGRDCKEEAFHTFSFGLNYSMKYNMNGGACTLHFMPYKNGSAVNMRFSIAQLAGARYGKYAEDLTQAAANILAKAAYNVNIDVEEFLKEENKVMATQAPVAEVVSTPVAEAVPTPVPVAATQPQPQYKHRFCTNCGKPLVEGAAFCTNCGAKIG